METVFQHVHSAMAKYKDELGVFDWCEFDAIHAIVESVRCHDKNVNSKAGLLKGCTCEAHNERKR